MMSPCGHSLAGLAQFFRLALEVMGGAVKDDLLLRCHFDRVVQLAENGWRRTTVRRAAEDEDGGLDLGQPEQGVAERLVDGPLVDPGTQRRVPADPGRKVIGDLWRAPQGAPGGAVARVDGGIEESQVR